MRVWGVECVCVGVFSVGFGPGLDSMSPARSRRSASHAAGTHGRLPKKTGRPGLRRGGVGGYNLHSVPPNSPPDCGTVAHQPRAGCILCSYDSSTIYLLFSVNFRPIFERAIARKFKRKVMQIIFRKYVEFEIEYGSEKSVLNVKKKAMKYTESLKSTDSETKS